MWITQALRNIDLMTNQGQSDSGLRRHHRPDHSAADDADRADRADDRGRHVLNRLGNDSELIVMNAAGMPPWRMFRPFLAVGVVVSLLWLRRSASISRPSACASCAAGRPRCAPTSSPTACSPAASSSSRQADDAHPRPAAERPVASASSSTTSATRRSASRILAEQGDILTNDSGTYLVLENGSVQRLEAGQRDPAIVLFDSYAFDLSRLSRRAQEHQLFGAANAISGNCFSPPPDDPLFADQPGQFRAELHDRVTAPLYPLAFVVVTFAYLGAPRTTRQSRAMSLVGAIVVVSAAARHRLRRHASSAPARRLRWSLPYVALIAALSCWGIWAIARGVIIEPPAFVTNAIDAHDRSASRDAPAALMGQPAMIAGNALALFRIALPQRRRRGVRRTFCAGRDDRLRRDAAAHRRHQGCLGAPASPRSRSIACPSSPSASCRSPCWWARCSATSICRAGSNW